MVTQFVRGSLTDSVSLQDIPFHYEPRVKTRDSTSYAEQNIIGNRLPNKQWVGQGSGEVTLHVFLLADTDMQAQLDNFRNLSVPQTDTGKPHPVYINMGTMYLGRVFVVEDIDTEVNVFQMEQMVPYECELKIKLCEIAVKSTTDTRAVTTWK